MSTLQSQGSTPTALTNMLHVTFKRKDVHIMKKLSCITLAVFLTFIAVSCLAEKTLNKMEFIDYNTEHFKFSAPA